MARQVQCTNCKDKYNKEDLTEYSKTKRLCKKCESEQREMDNLKKYICKIYKMEYVSPKLQKQINEFVTLHNYRPKAIQMIIDYAIKIEKFEIDTDLESITFVNYFKYNAIKYYKEKKEIKDSVKNFKKPEVKTAFINNVANGVVRNRKIFDLNDFDVEE